MWNQIVDMIYTAVVSAFSWLQKIFDSAPGAWGTFFTLFVIIVLGRFLLGPLLGTGFTSGTEGASDLAYKGKYDSGKIVKGSDTYKGKYEKRSAGGHRASPTGK